MGKPSKNSGGDERMNDRRYRASSNPSKTSSSEKQGEAESSSRSKQSGTALKLNSSVTKNKNKLRSPAKSGLGNPTNRSNRTNIVSEDKGVKKSAVIVKDKNQTSKMKQQTDNSEKREKKIESTDSTEQDIETIKHVIEEAIDNSFDQQENGLNGKQTSSNGNGMEIIDISEKEEDFNLLFDSEENGKHEENGVKNSPEIVEQENGEKIEETVANVNSAEQNLSSNTNSCSVDVVESTTPETSEAITSTKSSEVDTQEVASQDANEDENSDSSKKMKDIKIKLHDCLKDQKNEEEVGADQSAPDYLHKDDTFGKTLRTLSGRKSIGRHITLRERQPSPNSSLFVNTSSISASEDGTSGYKASRQRIALSELSSSNNGTPSDKKRRLVEETTSLPKKPKTEGSGLLNSSFEFLKNPFSRRSVQVSTPYKFEEADKSNISSSEEVKADGESGAARRWCVVM